MSTLSDFYLFIYLLLVINLATFILRARFFQFCCEYNTKNNRQFEVKIVKVRKNWCFKRISSKDHRFETPSF